MSINAAIGYFMLLMCNKYFVTPEGCTYVYKEDRLKAIEKTRNIVYLDEDVKDEEFVKPAFEMLKKLKKGKK